MVELESALDTAERQFQTCNEFTFGCVKTSDPLWSDISFSVTRCSHRTPPIMPWFHTHRTRTAADDVDDLQDAGRPPEFGCAEAERLGETLQVTTGTSCVDQIFLPAITHETSVPVCS